MDFSISWDRNVESKEDEKILNYSPLAKEIIKIAQRCIALCSIPGVPNSAVIWVQAMSPMP